MKQRNYKTTLKIAAVVHIMFFFTAAVMISCSSHSVNDVRATNEKKSKDSKPDPFLGEPKKLTKAEIKESEELTHKLFGVNRSLEVDMADMTGLELDSAGSVVISEDVIVANILKRKEAVSSNTPTGVSKPTDVTVDVPNAEPIDTDSADVEEAPVVAEDDDDEIVYEDSKPSINFTEILNKATISFIPERNREINTGFLIKVPKEMLSPSWSLTLTPKLLLNDSVITLKNVVLRGSEFTEKQKQSYQDYKDYLESIVQKTNYDDHFLDREGIRKDLRTLQDVYFDKYHQEWSNQVAFDTWRAKTLDTKTREFARKVGQRNDLYYKAQRDILDESMAKLALGKDTAGVYARHMSTFEKKAKHLPAKFVKPEIHENEVPKEFKDIFLHGRTVNDITNGYMTEDDSIKISKHHYLFDKIAENELKDSIKEEREQVIIPFPHQRDALVDTLMNGDQDFLFYYPSVSKMVEGAITYRLVVDSKVEAFPHNVFRFPNEDTMTYAISSLADLIDPKLVIKETKIYRNMYTMKTVYPKFETNRADFKITFGDNKDQMQLVADEYKTYIADQNLVLDSALVRVSSSLDGYFQNNYKLTANRGNSIKSFLATKLFPQLDVENIFSVRPVGEDWKTLVAKMNTRTDMPHKEEILDMIYATTDPDYTEQEIKLKYRTDYRIMKDSIYPLLRKLDVIFFMHRPGMETEDAMEYTEQPGYENGLKMMRERKYWDALQILSEYPDYNTALCLACMGHNEKAYSVIVRLRPNADVDYLRAILAYRLGNEEEAIQYLESACDADPAKAERVSRDPEMVLLIRKNNL